MQLPHKTSNKEVFPAPLGPRKPKISPSSTFREILSIAIDFLKFFVKESISTAALDGDKGLGLHTAPYAMKLAINKAKESGVGIVTLNNAGHLGAAGFHAKLAVDEDMIGVCMSGGGGFAMLPTFGAEPRFGTQPIAWAAPAEKEAYFMFDAAMTQIAGNKIK